ncbi:MAG TPA: ribosome maturation factor RimM, partial [Acidimicrobiales bacterium]
MLEVGRIVKPHGLHGEVVVELVTNRTERVASGSVLSDLVVERSRPFGDRWIVRFEGVIDFEGAERLRGTVLRAAPLDDPDVLWVHELIGDSVVTVSGRDLGVVAAVEANPASDLLVLDTGVLVPLRFV